MQRGPFRGRFAQQNSFCQGRLALATLAGSARSRLAHSLGGGLRRYCLVAKKGKPQRPSGNSPFGAPFSPRPSASPLCPIAVTVSARSSVAAQTPPAPCSSNQVGWGDSLQRRTRPNPKPDFYPATRRRKPNRPALPNPSLMRTPAKGCSARASSVRSPGEFPHPAGLREGSRCRGPPALAPLPPAPLAGGKVFFFKPFHFQPSETFQVSSFTFHLSSHLPPAAPGPPSGRCACAPRPCFFLL